MTAKEFLAVVNRGNNLQEGDLTQSLDLIAAYPYFTIPRILAAKIAVSQKNEAASEFISNAAVRVPNRSRLKELVYSEWGFINPAPDGLDIALSVTEQVNVAEPEPTTDTQHPAMESESGEKEAEDALPNQIDGNGKDLEENEVLVDKSPIDAISKRQEVLKQLEKNLSKLQENVQAEPVGPLGTEEAEPKTHQNNSGNSEPRVNELLEAIKKKEKKEIPNEKGKAQIELISHFTKKNIRLTPLPNPDGSGPVLEDLSISSTKLNDSMVSESFAKLLVKQKKLREAKNIYEKLQLKYPDKKAYFADCIKKLNIN
ncbi:hypothetical protein [Lunatimonas salinarum]|uniref:hypothetical protein n=1 Tax=Lunatimonas salinarum TaxID=1774590 RepID=UPI001AE0983E|nr:hypothetical protein [Lunatimonas salinarum]